MKSWRSLLVTLACVVFATPLVAQQASGPTPPAANAAQVSPATPASVVRPGPTIRPEWRRVESAIPDNNSSASSSAAAAQGSHTITVTTLVLVLLVILAVLLIA